MDSRFTTIDVDLSDKARKAAICIAPQDLTEEEVLGEGNFGKVCAFTINNPEILKNNPEIANIFGKKVVIKFFKDTDKASMENELEICSYLYLEALKDLKLNPQAKALYLMAVPLLDDKNRCYGLVSKHITCDIRKSKSQNVLEYVTDLAIAENKARTKYSDPDSRSDIGIYIVQLMSSMIESMRQLVERKIRHFDIAGRNFLVGQPVIKNVSDAVSLSVVAIDFGLSRIMKSIDEKIKYPHAKAPLRHLSPTILHDKDNNTTILDDWYALRSTFLELIVVGLSDEGEVKTLEDALYFSFGEDIDQHAKNKSKLEMTEATSLKTFYSNVFKLTNLCKDKRKESLNLVLNAFATFIALEQKPGLVIEAQLEVMYQMFLRANAKYAQAVFQNGIDRIRNRGKYVDSYHLLHDIQALLALPYAKAFKEGDFYKKIEKLQTSTELKSYVATLKINLTGDKKEMRSSSASELYMSEEKRSNNSNRTTENVFGSFPKKQEDPVKKDKKKSSSSKSSSLAVPEQAASAAVGNPRKRSLTRTITHLLFGDKDKPATDASTAPSSGNSSSGEYTSIPNVNHATVSNSAAALFSDKTNYVGLPHSDDSAKKDEKTKSASV